MRTAQRGQSMTEYLVVLGVTGAALLASMNDVSSIFDSVRSNYATQSREMNRVQLYDSHRVKFSEAVPGADIDVDDPLTPTPDTPLPQASLPTALFDDLGNLLGKANGSDYINSDGEIIASCDMTGVCKDKNNNIVSPTPVDDRGNALPLLALYDAQNNLLGFAYYRNNGYYHPSSFQPLSLPSGVNVEQREAANALYIGASKQATGYESRAKIYSLAAVFTQTQLTANALPTNDEQLLSVNYTSPPAGWENISPCVVLSNAQLADTQTISIGNTSAPVAVLGAIGKTAMSEPQTLRYVKTTTANCNSSKQATLYPGDYWVISDK